MKYLLILMLLTSCGYINRITQDVTGNAQSVCHNGISYLQFASGASVEYERIGPVPETVIKTCKE